eukprot:scaffold256022_cov35-Attheya_sp.AAC.1
MAGTALYSTECLAGCLSYQPEWDINDCNWKHDGFQGFVGLFGLWERQHLIDTKSRTSEGISMLTTY